MIKVFGLPTFYYPVSYTHLDVYKRQVYGDVEDGADVGSRINTSMRSDVLGKLLDGHDVSVL